MKSLTFFTLRFLRVALLVACLALAVEAARGGGSGGGGSSSSGGSSSGGDSAGAAAGSGYHPNNNDDNGPNSNTNSNSNSGSSSGTSINFYFGNGNAGGYRYRNRNGNDRAPFDTQQAMNYRTIHGILASLAMVVLFPIGSIILRVLPGKWGLWVHAIFQVLSTFIYIGGAALGIYLVTLVKIPSGSLLSNSSTNYHPILGLLLLALFLLQPIFGIVHHLKFRKEAKRQIWSYLHLVNGRGGIAIGIINGGLGLHLAQATNQKKTAYAAVAAVIGAIWIGVSIWAEVKRKKKLSDAEKPKEGEGEQMVKDGRRSGDERKTGITAWDIMK
ncbi:hypothetical protein QBC40DRAFT_213658 [Triangularia verruculosa]|uniref:Cytochrome b561 domain-containing protein n=1 Tax=Triangularia verruculosa TaxID=2587418 RepID=A0AAN6X5F0_9PEZI|nr:hypothetical protein QBC40DRAFT_213658 [Triangularia verruculosa]